MVGNVLFWIQIFEMEISMHLHVLRSLLSEITFLLVGLSLYMSVISTPKQIAVETKNLLFYICIIFRWYLKLYVEVEQIICVQKHTKKFENITAYVRYSF